MTQRIYLDNNASTPPDPRVVEAVIADLHNHIGNPSSVHFFGQDIKSRLSKARQTIATYLNVRPREVIFTSGGTEAINMVLRGVLFNNPQGHVISSNVEHSAVFATLKDLEKRGGAITFLSPGEWGAASVDAVRAALRPNTTLIALMAVNNETGVKTDIHAIASLAKELNIPFVVDGVALLGKEAFTIHGGVSAMCFGGHKLHAPKGIGCAFIRNNLKLIPQITGGDQEFGFRAGTENMPGIIGLAKAVEILKNELPEASIRMENLRNKLEKEIMAKLPNVIVNGQGPRVVNTSNLAFMGVEGEVLLTNLDLEGIAVSHGSACASGALEPSRILLNMGISPERASSSIRFSLSRFTTEAEIDHTIDVIVKVVSRLRKSI